MTIQKVFLGRKIMKYKQVIVCALGLLVGQKENYIWQFHQKYIKGFLSIHLFKL